MSMQAEVAQSVANRLSQREEVVAATVTRGRDGAMVECVCTDTDAKWTVKRDLSKYPVYVELTVRGG